MTISGAECVGALRLAGFRIVESRDGSTVLKRGRRVIVVPDAFVLSAEVLDGVLEEANLSHERFLWMLSEAATEPDLRAAPC
jgi:hypothetical protein